MVDKQLVLDSLDYIEGEYFKGRNLIDIIAEVKESVADA